VLRLRYVIGAVLMALGIFWAGRESDHGLSAFWEHWWCPIPLVMILLGLAAITAHRPTRGPRAT
jgi:hypothetical protein